jgi:hypothetical protein
MPLRCAQLHLFDVVLGLLYTGARGVNDNDIPPINDRFRATLACQGDQRAPPRMDAYANCC